MDQLDVLSTLVRHSGLIAAQPEPKLCAGTSDAARGRVLVLEDDPVQLELLRQHLRSLGFQVCSTSTIAAARQSLEAGTFQLAIFDVQLPDGNGLELCEQLDRDSACSGLPIIILSSLTEANVVRRTRAAGGRFFLGKPYDPNVLMAIIERAIDDHD